MRGQRCSRIVHSIIVATVVLASAPALRADELWVAASSQQDLGGLEIGSNIAWPVTPIGAVRLVWAVPDNLQTFHTAKVSLIPGSPAGAATLNVLVCAAQNGNPVAGACAGPFPQAFTGVPNQLIEIDIAPAIASRIGAPGATYLAVLAYTTPTTTTDHIVGLRFGYAAASPGGVATLGANTFSGLQTAPQFNGSFVGNGASLTNLPVPAGVAKLTANTFTATQTIDNGNLDLDASTATTGNITKNGAPFVHSFGLSNAFLGEQAGNLSMTGHDNAAVGFRSLMVNTSGAANSALGAQALLNNTTGGENTAVGHLALAGNTTGDANTAIGSGALISGSGGIANTATGASALRDTITGNSNTAVGFNALVNNTTGGDNVAVGAFAGQFTTGGSGNIYLGANVTAPATESHTMRLGNQGILTKTFVAGVRGITTANTDAVPVIIDSAGQLGTISSSIRFKEDIHDMADASRRLFILRPVTFRYTKPYANESKPLQFGLIAEEVAEAFPELAVRDANGNVETVHYETLNVLLLNELKKEHEEVQRQRQRIDLLEQRLNDLVREREIALVTQH